VSVTRPDGRAVGLSGSQETRSTRTSARFDPLLTYEAWSELGARIGRCSSATTWWLGDWLVFGRFKYGRRYKEAIHLTGLDYQTLRNYAVVARRFAPSRRRDDLTFQHHAEVCALPDDAQDAWLERAAAGGWTRNVLRRQLRAANERDERSSASEVLRLNVEAVRVERWREAARRADCDLEGWISRAVDAAALAAFRERG
jgi:hypothetical protein